VPYPHSVAPADLDGDGDLDLAVASSNPSSAQEEALTCLDSTGAGCAERVAQEVRALGKGGRHMKEGILAAGAAALLALALAGQGSEKGLGDARAPAPRLYRVIVPVEDIERAAGFYEELLGIAGKRVSGGRHYLDCGGVILALYQPSGDGDEGKALPLPDYVYFAVADLEAVFERAKRLGGLSSETGDGDLPMGEIATRPWRERSFYMRDPFGTPLCFVDERTLFTGR
jgi:predicted enzyme related to lactoylglutathione lyase